jgi:hypothetical protein
MADVYVERRQLSKDVALTWDIAHHLYTRHSGGLVVIVSESPPTLLAALRKQWLKVIAKLTTERSRTVEEARKKLLRQMIHAMDLLTFTVKLPDGVSSKDRGVYILKRSDLPKLRTKITTMYVTDGVDVKPLMGLLVRHGLIVEYEDRL